MSLAQTAWKWMLGVGLCAIGGYFLLPGAGAKDLAYSVIGLVSVAAVLVGTRLHPLDRTGWYAIAAGNLCFVLGDAVYDGYQFILHQTPPLPSLADVFYLAGYPFLIIGIVGVTRQHGQARAFRESYADAAIVTLGAIAVSWHFLMASYASDPTTGDFAKLITMAYPVMDLGLLFIVVRGLVFGRNRSPSLRLLAIAMVSMVVGDFAYDLLSLHGAYSVGNPVDAGWLIAYVLIGVAALHPAQGPRSLIEQKAEVHDGRRLPAIALAGFISPVTLLVGALLGYGNDIIVLSVISITLFGLIILRMRWMFTRIDRQSRSLVQALTVGESLEAELRHQAFHDALTGLPNRALLLDRMEQALAASSRSGKIVAVCFCDLDGFKSINDSLGHSVGDAILVAASKRLDGAIRPGDTVARLGGDEFAVLMDDVGDPSVAVAVAERIVSILHQPVEVDDRSVALSVSVGVAVATADSSAEQLLSEADSAMYEAKTAGRNRLAIFEQSMHARLTERLQLSSAFQGALERDEFFLQYQPQISLQDGSLQGFEALIRWNHPSLGVVVPDRFIPLAETTGNIIPIGRWVIEKACEQATQWAHLGGPPLTMAVNISALQLRDPHIIDDVRLAIDLGGLDPRQLVLEITESVLITDADYNLEVLAKLKDIGVRLAIDDFGTGYSSLSYLRRMPIDELKIDKTFVDPLADPSAEGAAFVSTIIKLAHTLGLNVVAEGIEHAEQRHLLSQLGCDNAQGYLWARPMDSELATEYVRGLSPLIDTGLDNVI